MAIDRDTTLDWMSRFAAEMHEHRPELVRLDTAIGDGDHGTNMDRGMTKAMDKSIEIREIFLLEKTGGKSGDFHRAES